MSAAGWPTSSVGTGRPRTTRAVRVVIARASARPTPWRFISTSKPWSVKCPEPARYGVPGTTTLPVGVTSNSCPHSAYRPGGSPASGLASQVANSRAGVLTRRRHVTRLAGRWSPSGMNPAVRRSSASCSHNTLSCRGIVAAQPLPRCVLTAAPARAASRSCPGVAAVWPTATTTFALRKCSMNASAPGSSGASVTSRMRPAAASCQRSNSPASGGRTCSRGCAPRGPSAGEMYGPSR